MCGESPPLGAAEGPSPQANRLSARRATALSTCTANRTQRAPYVVAVGLALGIGLAVLMERRASSG
jgi:hypothetical protein